MRYEHGVYWKNEEVLRVFAENITGVRDLLLDAITAMPAPAADCSCRHSLDGQRLPFDLP